jgi:hypothetical protein
MPPKLQKASVDFADAEGNYGYTHHEEREEKCITFEECKALPKHEKELYAPVGWSGHYSKVLKRPPSHDSAPRELAIHSDLKSMGITRPHVYHFPLDAKYMKISTHVEGVASPIVEICPLPVLRNDSENLLVFELKSQFWESAWFSVVEARGYALLNSVTPKQGALDLSDLKWERPPAASAPQASPPAECPPKKPTQSSSKTQLILSIACIVAVVAALLIRNS